MRSAGKILVAALLSAGGAGCQTDYARLPTFSAERHLLQAVVEVPAGTNRAQVYNPTTGEFEGQLQAGTDRRVEFLPYPGNYGFIPGTHALPAPGPAGRPLSVLVLAESQPAGTVVEVLPIGLLSLDDRGQLEQVVLAVPARPSQRILPEVTSWANLTRHFPDARQVLHLWFQRRGNPGDVRVVGWKDERAAEQLVRAAMNE